MRGEGGKKAHNLCCLLCLWLFAGWEEEKGRVFIMLTYEKVFDDWQCQVSDRQDQVGDDNTKKDTSMI